MSSGATPRVEAAQAEEEAAPQHQLPASGAPSGSRAHHGFCMHRTANTPAAVVRPSEVWTPGHWEPVTSGSQLWPHVGSFDQIPPTSRDIMTDLRVQPRHQFFCKAPECLCASRGEGHRPGRCAPSLGSSPAWPCPNCKRGNSGSQSGQICLLETFGHVWGQCNCHKAG